MATQKNIASLMLKVDKTPDEINRARKYIDIAQLELRYLSIASNALSYIFPIKPFAYTTSLLSRASSQLPQLLGDGRDSRFIIFFLNNYELRPGGGFIGSLGFVTLRDYSITKFEVQDVYEIDGQITDHHEPHYAVRRHLNQPNEFLRDSNFNPDFTQNAQKALRYLAYMPSYKGPYDGAIGITTTAVEDLLRITGPIELSDFNTIITSSNFFSVVQRKIETGFFPGSKQKRTMLQSLGDAMKHRLEDVSSSELLYYIYRVVYSKNLVLFITNEPLQKLFTNLDISGEQLNRTANWILPVDANIGVNKLDVLVQKKMEIQIEQKRDKVIQSFKSTYTNPITADAIQKETYKNYFQLYLPETAVLKKALRNNIEVTDQIRLTQDSGKTSYGIYLEASPASSTSISITYELSQPFPQRSLEVLKQVGAKPSSMTVIYRGEKTRILQRLLNSDSVFTF